MLVTSWRSLACTSLAMGSHIRQQNNCAFHVTLFYVFPDSSGLQARGGTYDDIQEDVITTVNWPLHSLNGV